MSAGWVPRLAQGWPCVSLHAQDYFRRLPFARFGPLDLRCCRAYDLCEGRRGVCCTALGRSYYQQPPQLRRSMEMDTAPRHLRVFLSSPGDVATERAMALRLLQRLQYDPSM